MEHCIIHTSLQDIWLKTKIHKSFLYDINYISVESKSVVMMILNGVLFNSGEDLK